MDGSFKTLFFKKCSEAAKLHGRNFASGFRAEYPGDAPYKRNRSA
jgi:hypothetical protein